MKQLSRNEVYARLKKDIIPNQGHILKETDTGFFVRKYDEEFFAYTPRHYTLQKYINQDWLMKKIWISPKTKKRLNFNKENISKYLLEHLPTEYFMTLEYIFIIYRQSELAKCAKIAFKGERKRFFTEIGLLFSEKKCRGLTANYEQCVFINARRIEKNIKKYIENKPYLEINALDGNTYIFDKNKNYSKYFKYGVGRSFYDSLFHEMRHILFANKLRDMLEYPEKHADEEYVLEFGRNMARNLSNKEKYNIKY